MLASRCASVTLRRSIPTAVVCPKRCGPHRFLATSTSTTKSSANPLEGDAGALATRVHHGMTVALAVLTPIYFIWPIDQDAKPSATNSLIGVLLSGNIAAHSWIGLNYVATDYVPKVSKALLGPARYVNAGIAVVTFLGLSKIAVSSPGGIRGVVAGVWNGDKVKKKGEFEF